MSPQNKNLMAKNDIGNVNDARKLNNINLNDINELTNTNKNPDTKLFNFIKQHKYKESGLDALKLAQYNLSIYELMGGD